MELIIKKQNTFEDSKKRPYETLYDNVNLPSEVLVNIIMLKSPFFSDM